MIYMWDKRKIWVIYDGNMTYHAIYIRLYITNIWLMNDVYINEYRIYSVWRMYLAYICAWRRLRRNRNWDFGVIEIAGAAITWKYQFWIKQMWMCLCASLSFLFRVFVLLYLIRNNNSNSFLLNQINTLFIP